MTPQKLYLYKYIMRNIQIILLSFFILVSCAQEITKKDSLVED